MTVVEVLPVKHLVTVNQRAKKVLQRKHLELMLKGRYTFVWLYFFLWYELLKHSSCKQSAKPLIRLFWGCIGQGVVSPVSVHASDIRCMPVIFSV